MAKDGRLVLPPLERQEPPGGLSVQSDATQQSGSHSVVSTVPMSPCFVPIEIDEDAALEPVPRRDPGPSPIEIVTGGIVIRVAGDTSAVRIAEIVGHL